MGENWYNDAEPLCSTQRFRVSEKGIRQLLAGRRITGQLLSVEYNIPYPTMVLEKPNWFSMKALGISEATDPALVVRGLLHCFCERFFYGSIFARRWSIARAM